MNLNSSNENSQSAPPSPDSTPVRLRIRGIGHPPSFKNTKSIFKKKGGQRFIGTAPKKKKWMDQATRLFESQLRSEFQTRDIATSTAPHRQFSIASVVPLDDSRQWIKELTVTYVKVPKGEEGCDVVIERFPTTEELAAFYAAAYDEVIAERETK